MSRTRLSTYTAPPAEVARTLDALRAHYEVPTAFPPEALAEAEAAAGAWAQDGPARLLADGALHASGERCDLSAYLPLVRLPG